MSDFDELVDRVKALTGLESRDAFRVADALDADLVSAPDIVEKAIELGFDIERKHDPDAAPVNDQPLPEISTNPVEVLAAMYRECPRVLAHNVPVVGRVPKESLFYDEDVQEMLKALPENLRLLIGSIDIYNGTLTVTLYDEANDLDRKIGPIDLERFDTQDQLETAIRVLLGRLHLVLAADSN